MSVLCDGLIGCKADGWQGEVGVWICCLLGYRMVVEGGHLGRFRGKNAPLRYFHFDYRLD